LFLQLSFSLFVKAAEDGGVKRLGFEGTVQSLRREYEQRVLTRGERSLTALQWGSVQPSVAALRVVEI
jgi:hypothetical protein